METIEKITITVGVSVNAPIEKVWELWTNPEHIRQWCHAGDDWHAPFAENDLRINGRFRTTMAEKDGKASFDFEGIYTTVIQNKRIDYEILDGRKVSILFSANGNTTTVSETFEAEQMHSPETQKEGWQLIANNFKKYAESYNKKEKLHFEISINAAVEKVYKTMLDKIHYSEWTSEFNPTSRFEGSWEKGSKILFVGTDEDGNAGGMVGQIQENIPNRYVSIQYLGILKSGNEITSGPEVDEWAGGFENYWFSEANGKTLLSVEIDTNAGFKSYFLETYPKALNRLKAICES
jgi:uncharacterized protein YndB with AHSA1/START domain